MVVVLLSVLGKRKAGSPFRDFLLSGIAVRVTVI
jgi:hypothetical protein